MRSEISFHDVPLSAIDVPGSSFFWREEKGRRCVQAGPHAAWPQLFEERAVVSGREVTAQDEPQVAWPHAGAARGKAGRDRPGSAKSSRSGAGAATWMAHARAAGAGVKARAGVAAAGDSRSWAELGRALDSQPTAAAVVSYSR